MSRFGRRSALAFLVAVVVTGALAPLVLGGALGRLGQQLGDLQFPTGHVDDRLVVVELPLAATDWTRAEHASLIRALHDAGTIAVGYDVVFDTSRDGDDELAAALAEAGDVILAATAVLTGEVAGGLPQAATVTRPGDALATSAAGIGNANVLLSRVDGVVRDVPLVIETSDRRLVPSLSLATVLVAEGQDPGAVTLRSDSGVSIGSRLVPTDPARGLEITWSVPWSATRSTADRATAVTAAEVLDGSAKLDGAVVLVGVVDQLVDTFATPLDRSTTPGVYVQANATNTMLTNQFRSGPDPATAMLAVAGLASLVAAVGMLTRLSLVPVVGVGLLIGWQAVVNLGFQTGRNLDNVWPNVAVLLAVGGVVATRYVTEVRERRRVAGLFRQYVPDRVADDLLASERLSAAAEGERVDVTVLFCDLRGFTAIAAEREPGDVRAMLEAYYDVCTRIVHEHDGTVMQFVGDEVFAVFGTPLPQTDHAQRALDAAVAMQAGAPEINAALASRGVEVSYGIGLNTGNVVAAHVGSQVHRQYAVVGQTVNVGARLCSLAEPGGIVMSKWTLAALSSTPSVVSLGTVALKGVTDDPEPVRIVA